MMEPLQEIHDQLVKRLVGAQVLSEGIESYLAQKRISMQCFILEPGSIERGWSRTVVVIQPKFFGFHVRVNAHTDMKVYSPDQVVERVLTIYRDEFGWVPSVQENSIGASL